MFSFLTSRTGLTQIIKEAWSGIWAGPRPIKALVLGVQMGSKKGHSFSLWFRTMVFQAEIYAIKACIMENYKGRNIYILSNSQAAITA
jgi:hypothetical protein